MASRLSSLLVRDGLVGVKRMEKAFQRQVIYGGSLDTTLLEMNLVPEERLAQYLSLATGLPPAARTETNVFDPEAVRRCPADVAEAHFVVPLCFEDTALRVLVHDPVDMSRLEALADALDLPVQPLVVPEYRFHVVSGRMFGKTVPARFSALAKLADAAPPTAPVGKARTVIVDGSNPPSEDEQADHEVVDVGLPPSVVSSPAAHMPVTVVTPPRAPELLAPVGPGAQTMRMAAVAVDDVAVPEATPARPTGRTRTQEMSTPALSKHAEEVEDRRRAAEEKRHPTAPPIGINAADGVNVAVSVSGEVTVPVATPAATAPVGTVTEPLGVIAPHAAPVDPAAPRAPLSSADTPLPAVAPRPVAPPRAAEPLSTEPLSVSEARRALADAGDRDLIFGVLLRAVRKRADYAGLLTIQGGAAIGRIAIAGNRVDSTEIGSVLIPLDTPSAFRTSASSGKHHLGPIATNDAEIDRMIARMTVFGQAVPVSALLLPVVLRERVVALVIGHRGDKSLPLPEVAELLPLAGAAADAISRLIVKSKAVGFRAPTGPAQAIPVITEDIATKRIGSGIASKTAAGDGGGDGDGVKAAGWSAPTPEAAAAHADSRNVQLGAEVSITAEEPEPIDAVLDAIESAADGAVEEAMEEALARTAEALPKLGDRFPGKLRVDRYQVGGRALRASQHGGLLDLLVRMGSVTGDLLVDKMSDPNREVRFYATLCAAELRPRSALSALAERLFDADYGIRATAIDALAGYPARELDHGLVRARHALHADDAERVHAASSAIAELGDIAAIGDLLDAIDRGGRIADHARSALMTLTRQDFGTSGRKWRAWWDKNKKRHRLEWLIEALGHKETELRKAAAEDLRRLTGEYFGFHHDQPRKEREAAQARWESWWNDTGRRRFVRGETDERNRPTAIVPVTTPKREP